MGKPVLVRKVVVEFSIYSITILRESLNNYHQYLKDVQAYEHTIPLSKSAIKRRIKYLEEFIESIDIATDEEVQLPRRVEIKNA